MSVTCPKCGYVRQPGDTAPDYECPKCGVVYAKAKKKGAPMSDAEFELLVAESKARQEAEAARLEVENAEPVRAPQAARASSPLGACVDCGGIVSKLALGCPHCGRSFGDQRQPVVVMDVSMGFESMVTFMVKWVLASIPAFIILVLFFLGVTAGFTALFGGGR